MSAVSTAEGGVFVSNANSPVLEISLGSPALGATSAVHAAITSPDTGTTVVTTGITSPAVPRNLTITGSASGMTGNVVIAGTDANDASLSETIALSGSSTVVGNKAFKTVTSVTVPAKVNSSGDTVAIGTGAKLGLGHYLPRNTVLAAFLANVREGTAPTVAVSSSVIASNTVTLSSALNGTAVIVTIYLPRL